ncbi:MAG: hypothetical protein Q4A31_01925 [Corynebacterium sp.]|uniref:hypothetical protein n=1 Tax=Corynebacterium sp. TaxID=1720 RepID=UPI0026DD11E2|nr:hypothetical protein [Corynebacterium sp.]MDO4760664.1 hypothetical protein [Corynebacterium sp.]
MKNSVRKYAASLFAASVVAVAAPTAFAATPDLVTVKLTAEDAQCKIDASVTSDAASLAPFKKDAEAALADLKEKHGFSDDDFAKLEGTQATEAFVKFTEGLDQEKQEQIAFLIVSNIKLSKGEFFGDPKSLAPLKDEVITKADAKKESEEIKAELGKKPELSDSEKKYEPLLTSFNKVVDAAYAPFVKALDACVAGKDYDSTVKPMAPQGSSVEWNTKTIVGVVLAVIAALGGLFAAVGKFLPNFKNFLKF